MFVWFVSCPKFAGLDYSLSGDVVSVSGYPSSEGMDEDYVLEVFEGIHDGARIVS
jgi:hypothetical protein